MHVLFAIANNSSVPYFKLFMEKAAKDKTLHFSFVALTTEFPEMINEAKFFGFDGYWVPFDCTSRKSQMIKAIPKLHKLFRRLKPDIVHSHLFDDSLPVLFAARIAGIPIRIITKQDTAYHFVYARKWVKADRFNNWNATHVIAVSEEAKEFVRDIEKCPTNKLSMIHHGISISQFLDIDKDWVTDFKAKHQLEGRFVIGTVARLIDWKGYLNIIEVAEMVVKKIPEALFLWAGNGDQKPLLEKKIKQKGLENNIRLTGFIEKAKMANFYYSMDLYLHAAKMEPFGFVIAEAMVSGIPVVSTPTGAARDAIIHKENGWIGDYTNPKTLADGILFYYNNMPLKPYKNSQDTALKMYDFSNMYNNYINLFKEALNETNT
jgi:glycosyltransferase involved in cell wall biosynthesis